MGPPEGDVSLSCPSLLDLSLLEIRLLEFSFLDISLLDISLLDLSLFEFSFLDLSFLVFPVFFPRSYPLESLYQMLRSIPSLSTVTHASTDAYI